MIYIGIDPGSTTGLAVSIKRENIFSIKEFSSHAAALLEVNRIIQFERADEAYFNKIKVIIEDARLAKPRPDLKEVNKGKLQGVGYVKAYSKDWEQFCILSKVPYELRPPSNTKVSPEYFEKLTGLKTTKTQSHCRDAGMLVYGR